MASTTNCVVLFWSFLCFQIDASAFTTVRSVRRKIAVVRHQHANRNPQDVTIGDNEVTKRIYRLLEETTPENVSPSQDEFEEKDENEENPDFDPASQIFDPMSFWTERSGRFPRNK